MKWIITGLVVLVAGYMVVDGLTALIKGDYIRPRTGSHAGELGPWARIVSGLGIEPTSTGMKVLFVGYGTAWLVILGFYIAGAPWARAAMMMAAVGSLWYAPFGTLLGLVQIALLWIHRLPPNAG
jgi:hypothetical protein